MKHVVMYSCGLGSWGTAWWLENRIEGDEIVLLFADTLIEDADLYRFLDEGAAALNLAVTRITEGRTPWEVFRDVKFLGNTRIDPCSRVLKREPLRKWLDQNCDPEDTLVYLGMDWTEIHRFERAEKYWEPWYVRAPLCEEPYISKDQILKALERKGVKPPRLYEMGFAHNNCGGMCVKMGQAQAAHTLKMLPAVYDEWERNEQTIRDQLGDVSILRDRKGGVTTPLTLAALRERIAKQPQTIDMFDWGGCGCMEESDVENEKRGVA